MQYIPISIAIKNLATFQRVKLVEALGLFFTVSSHDQEIKKATEAAQYSTNSTNLSQLTQKIITENL
ncbi:MAG: hypothetical protein K0R08_2031 [Solimicrobium sp.]|nr:hypothetical protein [Solimicrobium sp.]